MWENSIYKFRLPKLTMDEDKAIEITIDVTKSIPKGRAGNFVANDLRKNLGDVLRNYPIKTVMDFGSGNFKNTLFLLRKGLTVHSVDFETVLDQENVGDNYKECLRHNSFTELIFPHDFFNSDHKYDLVLLSHVFPIMPVFIERLLVLQYLHNLINTGKYIFWYSQVENSDYKSRRTSLAYKCGDGIWMGKNKKYKTFFKHFDPLDIDELFYNSGFVFLQKSKCSMGHMRLYQRVHINIFKDHIDSDNLQPFEGDETFQDPRGSDIIVDLNEDTPTILPNLDEHNIKNLYKRRLRSINPGGGRDATSFHRLSANIFWFSLYSQISNMKIEDEIDDGFGRIDITFQNLNKNGIFKDLKEMSDINCPKIIVECKNKSGNFGNHELNQIQGRLNRHRGMLGFLITRNIDNYGSVISQCQRIMDREDKYIILLNDDDLLIMLEKRFEIGEEGVNTLIREKFDELIT